MLKTRIIPEMRNSHAMASKYFKLLANNGRAIMSTVFTAEDVGGFGSQKDTPTKVNINELR